MVVLPRDTQILSSSFEVFSTEHYEEHSLEFKSNLPSFIIKDVNLSFLVKDKDPKKGTDILLLIDAPLVDFNGKTWVFYLDTLINAIFESSPTKVFKLKTARQFKDDYGLGYVD